MSSSLLSQMRTTAQLAELLQMKRSTVEDYARRGILPSIKVGRHRRFFLPDVEAALEALRSDSASRHPPANGTPPHKDSPARRPDR